MKDISNDIIGAAIEVHKALGPGLLENCYQKALAYELTLRGHNVKTEGKVPIMYKGVDLSDTMDGNHALRYDMVVDDCIVIELKSAEELKPVHFKQLLTYLRFLHIPIGLLFNFNVNNLMREGFGRVVSGYTENSEKPNEQFDEKYV